MNPTQNALVSSSTPPTRNDLVQKSGLTFCRPVTLAKNGGASVTESQSYIWAVSKSGAPSSDKDKPSATFDIHDQGSYGSFSTNFLLSTGSIVSGSTVGSSILTPSGSMTKEFIIQLHGFFMWAAWFLCPVGGVFVARYMKSYLGHYWYRIHMIVMGLGTVGTGMAGSILIFLYTSSTEHFKTSHATIGLVAFICMILQAFLGYVCDLMYDPKRPGIPIVDYIHWWFGRAIILLGIVNIQLGLDLYKTLGYKLSPTATYLNWGFIVVALALFAMGEYLVGQINHGAFDDYQDHDVQDKRFSIN